jgi:hypothetical protein
LVVAKKKLVARNLSASAPAAQTTLYLREKPGLKIENHNEKVQQARDIVSKARTLPSSTCKRMFVMISIKIGIISRLSAASEVLK